MDNTIDKIIHDHLTGIATPEEETALKQWLEKEDNRQMYRRLLERHDLLDRYRQCHEIDEEKAWQSFRNEHFPIVAASDGRPHRSAWLRWVGRCAAVAAIAVGIVWMADKAMTRHDNGWTLPEKELKAQEMARSTGRQQAILTLVESKSAAADKEPNKGVYVNDAEGYRRTLEDTPADAVYQLATEDMSEFWVKLEDGTMVHLNYDTRMKYPAKFASNCRMVSLDGEAYFKVKKETGRPFYVVTPHGTIKEYGTEFNVNTRQHDGSTGVVLVEGKISVTPIHGREQELHPGEMASIGRNDKAHIERVDVGPYKAWNEGEYVFRDTRLDELTELIGKWYGLQVVFDHPDDAAILFTGTIDKYGRIESILNAINKVTGLDIELNNHVIVVK